MANKGVLISSFLLRILQEPNFERTIPSKDRDVTKPRVKKVSKFITLSEFVRFDNNCFTGIGETLNLPKIVLLANSKAGMLGEEIDLLRFISTPNFLATWRY